MASKQRHDIGYKKRLAAAPIMEAAALRREARKQIRQDHPKWFKDWLRMPQGKCNYDMLAQSKDYLDWLHSPAGRMPVKKVVKAVLR